MNQSNKSWEGMSFREILNLQSSAMLTDVWQLVEGLQKDPSRVRDMSNNDCWARAKEGIGEAVEAALLISGTDKQRYGKLKDKLVSNYLLGTD